MMNQKNSKSEKIKEAWSGPGRQDRVITEYKPEHDGLHIDMKKKRNAEWWYFDARLENDYVVVGFFRAKHERTGKTGVEITIYTPSGKKIQNLYNYSRSDLTASPEFPDVQIGQNYIKADYSNPKLPTYEVFMDEGEYGLHLKYTAKVNSWMPGSGYTEFGDMGHFGWSVALPRAYVEGTIKVNNETIPVKGIGYHDHNWINFNLVKVVEYWYWGRIFSEHFTLIYAIIQCNKKMGNYPIQVLMLAKDEKVILSTGEFEFIRENMKFNETVDNYYPEVLKFSICENQHVSLQVQEVIDGDNLLFEFNPILRFIVKYFLRLKPGYFRFKSEFNLNITYKGETFIEKGTTLHEMVQVK
jgi:hypothetical protein